MYMAPEIVKEEPYKCKVDVWSVGVIAHVLLTGCPPFFAKTQQEIYDALLHRQPGFGRVKDQLSKSAIDFTLQCLEKDPELRPTAAQLLLHPFITDNVQESSIDSETALVIGKDLTSFYKQSIFQTGVISFITGFRVQQSEFENLNKMFLALDTSEDGFLTLDEVRMGLVRWLGEFKSQSDDWQVLIAQLDTNNDGRIDYGEFISAAINKGRLLSLQNLTGAFKLIDKDGNGFISR